jgi:hypothetical protein
VTNELGGGFYGTTYSLRLDGIDVFLVLKTARPGTVRNLLRTLNWKVQPFPPRTFDAGARHDYLASKLIHRVVTRQTGGRVVTPTPYGYALTSDGFAQLRERLSGRPPRLDLDRDEVRHFRQVQRLIVELCTVFGMEQMGQVHPANPFGMENLWRNPDARRWEWPDDLAAIRHTVYVPPWYVYPDFHLDVRRRVRASGPTYNRIHTDTFRGALRACRGRYPTAEYDELHDWLDLYDTARSELDGLLALPRSLQTITGWEQRGTITPEQAARLRATRWHPGFFVQLIREGLRAAGDGLVSLARRIAGFRLRAHFLILLLHAPTIKEELLLDPAKKLHARRLISDVEMRQARVAVESENLKPYITLTGLLFALSQVHNVVEPLLYGLALASLRTGRTAALLALSGFLTGWVFPSITRGVVTYLFGLAARIPVRLMYPNVLLPKLLYLSGPARQAIASDPVISHGFYRQLAGQLSDLSHILPPRGGWTEEEVYVALRRFFRRP